MSVFNLIGSEILSAYNVSGLPVVDVYDKAAARIGFDQFLDRAILTAMSPATANGIKQGGCTDGEYIYQTSGDTANYTYMNIIKYKISDGTYTVTQFNGTPNFGHANDMTYNPNDHCLYIPTMLDDGSVIVLDASNLTYVRTMYFMDENGSPYKLWQLCFDRITNHFISARGNLLVYDQDGNYLSKIVIPTHPDAVSQGAETDGTYYYRLCYNPNEIDIIRLSTGERVMIMPFTLSGEPEAIMYDWNGNFYISKYTNGDVFYRAQLFEES